MLFPLFPLISRHLCLFLHTATMHIPSSCSLYVCTESASLYAGCCYTSPSLEIKERSWSGCWERKRRKELGEEGQRRGREVIETDSDCKRNRDATGWNEKVEGKNNKRVEKMEKAFNRWVFLPACSSLFCFITSALSSADSTASVAEVVWRHCGLAETWKTLWCHVLRCSSGLRGEISLAIPLTPGNWAIEMVLPPLTEQHDSFPSISWQRSAVQTPKIPAEVEQQGDCFFFYLSFLSYLSGISLCFLSSLVTNFSRVWVSFVPSLLLEISQEHLWQRRWLRGRVMMIPSVS